MKYNATQSPFFFLNSTLNFAELKGRGGSAIKLCLARPGADGVNGKNALPVIIVAFRKWASPPLPGLAGGFTGKSLYSAQNSCNNDSLYGLTPSSPPKQLSQFKSCKNKLNILMRETNS